MSAQTPNMLETLNNGVIQQIPDIFRDLRAGGAFDNLVRGLASQPFGPVGGGAAVTFAELGLPDATHALFSVVAVVQATGAIIASSAHATTGFTLAAGANATGYVVNGGQFVHVGAVASNAITLPSAPDAILDVIATVGTSAGRKTLKIGSSLTPSAGEVVWNGATGLTFAAADAVTQAKVILAPTSFDTTSFLSRLLGQRD